MLWNIPFFQVDIKYKGYYAEVITNRNLAQLYRKHCEDMGIEFSNDPGIAKSLGGSTDMGNVSFVVPSIHPMFAINTDAPNHSREFTKAAGISKLKRMFEINICF